MVVHLGLVQDEENNGLLESRFFPSKIGGRPAWLDLKYLPPIKELSCEICNNPTHFLCQLYCPIDEKSTAFHRAIFVFVCLTKSCFSPNDNGNFVVFRCQLSRENSYYPSTPPIDDINWHPEIKCEKYGINLCDTCGIISEAKCKRCGFFYCCDSHCFCYSGQSNFHNIQEFEIYIEVEEPSSAVDKENSDSDSDSSSDEERRIKEFKQISGKLGLLQNDCTLEKYIDELALSNINDEYFIKFKNQISSQPEQVIRYTRDSEPLWLTENNIIKSNDVPHCEYCGGERQFEFQVLPQMLNYLKLDTDETNTAGILDWGTLVIYTCKDSCDAGPSYKKEFLWKQDII